MSSMASSDSAVTVPGPEESAAEDTRAHATAEREDPQAFVVRYTIGDQLGEGGMGVVHACRDRRIGRDLALKMVRAEHARRADLISRFVREACVQGQLEHPAIVPVYDLARDPDGNVYFTMKRVRGATFEQILAALRDGDERIEMQFSRRKLLTAFGSVCQALHFAHARGVIHRDLKPGNVILGDFGEVYVLDWGLAKLTTAAGLADDGERSPGSSGGPDSGAAGTSVHGATMGTPGYMSPEQVRGEAVDVRSDVYALGALLFELLARQPLHPSGSREASFASTLFGPDARPSVRAPHLDLPPELDAICSRATALEARDRFGTAKQIVDAIERFLDGDRDLQRRRELARDHARLAASHAERAFATGANAAESTEARGRALRDAGRAIALDPSNSEAVGTIIRLLTDPPRQLPPEALAELERERNQSLGTGDLLASRAFSSFFLLAPIALLMGVRSRSAAILTTAAWLGAAAVSYASSRAPRGHGKASLPILLTGGLAISCATTFFGPFFFLPGFAVIYGMMFVLVPPDRSRRWLVVAVSMLTILAPAALGWLGVTAQPYELGADAIVIHGSMLHFPPLATQLFLLSSSLSVVLTACLMSARVHDALAQAQERLHVQAWQLRQMLPRAARIATADSSDPPRAAAG
jgi:eukaryotic-like serine/threonine-protein kinase